MKRITLIMLAWLVAIASSEAQNVVNLKNGSIIRGELIEYLPGEKTTIQTPDGNIFVFDDEDIASVTRDESKTVNKMVSGNEKFLAPRGYRGFVDITPFDVTFQGLAFSMNTTHGYQFNHNVFVGGGIGFSVNYGSEYFSIPIYASFKGNVARGAVQFTYGINMGLGIGRGIYSDYSYDYEADYYRYYEYIITGTSFYNNYSIGMRFALSPDFAIKLISEMDLYMGAYVNFGWGIGLGFEF